MNQPVRSALKASSNWRLRTHGGRVALTRLAFAGLLCCMFGAELRAQQILFRHLTREQGLPSDKVTSIVQDKKGFLWFGTDTRLTRYDGYSFLSFRNEPKAENSLPPGKVTALLVDHSGVLWIGTDNAGLARMRSDRTTFDRFSSDKTQDGIQLSDPGVEVLFEDAEGTLWVGSYSGLTAISPDRKRAVQYSADPENPATIGGNSVTSIVQTADGIVYVGTSTGLSAFDSRTKSWTRINVDRKKAPHFEDYITALHVGSDGLLWIGTVSGILHAYDRKSGSCSSYQLSTTGSQTLFSEHSVTSIHGDDRGALWIGITGEGLFRFDTKKRTYSSFRHDPASIQSLSGDDVTTVFGDVDGMIWIGTDGHGINSFQNNAALFALYRNPFNEVLQEGAASVTALCRSRNGKIWIGTIQGAVGYYTPGSGVFNRLDIHGSARAPVMSIVEDTRGILWFGTMGGGLLSCDPTTNAFRVFRNDPADPASIGNNDIQALAVSENGAIWIGTAGAGLIEHDPVRGTFTSYRGGISQDGSLGGDFITTLLIDKSGTMYLGTERGGVLTFDRSSGKFKGLVVSDTAGMNLATASVSAMLVDKDGALWIGTAAGLYRRDAKSGRVRLFNQESGLPIPIVRGMLQDTQGNLWISASGGLIRFALRKLPVEKEGAPASTTARDRLPVVNIYDINDGLQGNEFNRNACVATENGVMYFGGQRGLNAFQPDDINRRMRIPSVQITDLQLFNNSVIPGDNTNILKSAITETDAIVLSHDQNVITFEFAVLQYENPVKNGFAYMLEGFDPDWTHTGAQKRYATYTNLAPGDYVFRLRGRNSAGTWNDEGIAIHITVLPPWYKTTTAYVIYAFTLIFLIVGGDRLQRARVIAKERREAQIREAELRAAAAEQQSRAIEAQARAVAAQAEASEARARTLQVENEAKELELNKARELEKAYSDLREAHNNLQATQTQLIHAEKMASLGQLTAGIAHEIKNPLNFVNNFADLSQSLITELREEIDGHSDALVKDSGEFLDPILDDLNLNLQKIAEHGKRADGIVRSMLLHSAGKAGDKRPTEINTLLDEYVTLAFHGARANDPEFNLIIEKHYDQQMGYVTVIAQEIARVFLNLLNNAIDAMRIHAQTAGRDYHATLTVATHRGPDAVSISVSDNGPGIPPEIRERIFQPFFTTKPAGSGTGLGLSISYDIVVQGHKGNLVVESEVGRGSTFTVSLPVNDEA